MSHELNELRRKSLNSDKDAQITLFFKLCYDLKEDQEALNLCWKLKNAGLLFFGLYHFKTISKKEDGTVYTTSEDEQKRESISFEIFNSFADPLTENLETYYAWIMLGSCYRFGRGVDKSKDQAYIWYNKAADKGVAFADYSLGYMYMIDKEFETAQYYLKKAADNGWDRANLKLGLLYFSKVVDYNLAYHYLMAAAKLNKSSKNMLGKILATGCIEWNISNHKYWINTNVTSILRLKQADKEIDKVVYVTSFVEQVLTLLLISKFRQVSRKTHVFHISRMVVLSIIKPLARLYLI